MGIGAKDLVVAVFVDSAGAKAGSAEVSAAMRSISVTAQETAKAMVAATASEIEELQGLKAAYAEIGAAAKAGSSEAIAASTLQMNAMKKLGDSTASTTSILEKMSQKAMVVGKSMTTYLTVPILALAAESTKMAIDFQKNMELIHTQAGASQKEVTVQSKNVLNYASSGGSPQGPNDLAGGLYHLESLGLRGAAAMKALKIASQEAGMGMGSLEDTATALGGTIVSGIQGAKNYTQAMSTVNAIIGAGNIRLTDWNAAMSTGVLATAKGVGMSLPEVGAGIDVLTDRGMGAQMAATRLKMGISMAEDPNASAIKSLNDLGISATQMATLMQQPNGFLKVLNLLKAGMDSLGSTAADKTRAIQDFMNAFGKGRSSSGMLTEVNSLSSPVSSYEGKLTDVEASTQQKYLQEIAAYHKTAAYQIDTAWASIQASMIKAGNSMAPLVVTIAHGVKDLVSAFTSLSPGMKEAIGSGLLLVATIGPLVLIVGKLTQAFTALTYIFKGVDLLIAKIGGIGGASAAAAEVTDTSVATMTASLTPLDAEVEATSALIVDMGVSFTTASTEAAAAITAIDAELLLANEALAVTAGDVEALGAAFVTDETEIAAALAVIEADLAVMATEAEADLAAMETAGAGAAAGIAGIGVSALGILAPLALAYLAVKKISGAGTGWDLSSGTTGDTDQKVIYHGKYYSGIEGTDTGDAVEQLLSGGKMTKSDLAAFSGQNKRDKLDGAKEQQEGSIATAAEIANIAAAGSNPVGQMSGGTYKGNKIGGTGSLQAMMAAVANQYGLNPAAFIADSFSESGLNPNVTNSTLGPNGGGLFQFKNSTWQSDYYKATGKYPNGGPRSYSPQIQAQIAAAAMQRGGIGQGKDAKSAMYDMIQNFEIAGASGDAGDEGRGNTVLSSLIAEFGNGTGTGGSSSAIFPNYTPTGASAAEKAQLAAAKKELNLALRTAATKPKSGTKLLDNQQQINLALGQQDLSTLTGKKAALKADQDAYNELVKTYGVNSKNVAVIKEESELKNKIASLTKTIGDTTGTQILSTQMQKRLGASQSNDQTLQGKSNYVTSLGLALLQLKTTETQTLGVVKEEDSLRTKMLDTTKSMNTEIAAAATKAQNAGRESLKEGMATMQKQQAASQLAYEGGVARGIIGIPQNPNSDMSTNAYKQTVQTSLNAITKITKDWGVPLTAAAKSSIKKVQDVLKQPYIPSDVRTKIASDLTQIKGTVTTGMNNVIAALKSKASDFKTLADQTFSQIFSSADTAFSQTTSDTVTSMTDAMNAQVKVMQQATSDALEQMNDQVTDTVQQIDDANKQAVANLQVTVSGAGFSSFQYQATTATGASSLTPTEQIIQNLQTQHDQVTAAQQLINDQNAGDTDAVANDLYNMQITQLQAQADLERTAANTQLQTAQDSLTEQQQDQLDAYQQQQNDAQAAYQDQQDDLVQNYEDQQNLLITAYQNQRTLQQTEMDLELQDQQSALDNGTESLSTYTSNVSQILSNNGIDANTMAIATGQGLVNGLGPGINAAIDMWNAYADAMNAANSGKTSGSVNIPTLSGGTITMPPTTTGPVVTPGKPVTWGGPMASGGIVTSPQYHMIGEAGPEAVIPLSKLGGMGGGNIHIHFDGPVIGTGLTQAATQLEPHIRAAIIRAQKRNVTSGII